MALFNRNLDPRDNPALRRILAESMPDTFRWLLRQGIRFYGPMPEPPHRKPRMHSVIPNSNSFITHLGRAARRAGVVIRPSTKAVRLLVDHGRVAAVECESGNNRHRYRLRGGVVLATGDFTSDPGFKSHFMGERESKIDGVNVTATGDGHRLALELGARIVNGDLALGPELRFIPPTKANLLLRLPPWSLLADITIWSLDHLPRAILRPFIMSFVTTALSPSVSLFAEGAILVNKHGERFCDERDQPAFSVADQPDKIAYIIIDGTIAKKFSQWPHFISTAPGVAYAFLDDYRRNRSDIFTRSNSPEELSNKLVFRNGALVASIDKIKLEEGDHKFDRGPYIALGPVRSVFVLADGGLAVDQSHRVLGAGDKPIEGLFAAGSTGQGGLLLRGHGHHLGWAFSSGRRAGRNAAFAATTANLGEQ